MDYCHHCQRHLNGALACAGCGTPAEELRLHDPVPHEAEVVLAVREHGQEPAAGPRRQRGSRKRKVSRRERREMRAERGVHRRKGRVVLLTVMGLVLAVGALSLAELALESSGDDGDATSVQEDRAIEIDGGPPPTGPTKAEDPVPVTGTPSESTSSPGPGGDGSPDPSASGTGSGSSDGEESPAPTESADPGDGPDPSDSPGPTGSTGPSGDPSTSGQPNQPPPPQPSTSTEPPAEDDDGCVLLIFCF